MRSAAEFCTQQNRDAKHSWKRPFALTRRVRTAISAVRLLERRQDGRQMGTVKTSAGWGPEVLLPMKNRYAVTKMLNSDTSVRIRQISPTLPGSK